MKKSTFLTMLLAFVFISTSNIITAKGQTYYPVELFKDINFGGGTPNQYGGAFSRDLMDDGWNDNVESIKVGKGFKVTLYEDKLHRGSSIVLYPGEYPDLSMQSEHRFWNDRTSSLKIEKLSDPNLPLIKLIYGDNGNLTQMIGLDGVDEYKNVNSLLLNDRVTSAEIPAEYKVTFYDHKEYGGDANTTVASGRTVNMSEFDLYSKVSSIKIEWNMYQLTDVKTTLLKTTNGTTEEVPTSSQYSCNNANSSNPLTCTQKIERKYTSTATTEWDNTTTAGVTATASVSAGVNVGLATSSTEYSLAVSLSNAFRFGASNTASKERTLTAEASQTVQPGGWVGFDLSVTPGDLEYDVEYTYTPVLEEKGTDGKYIVDNSRQPRIVKGKMTVKDAVSYSATAKDMPGAKVKSVGTANSNTPAADQGMMARAMEWIKERPCRLYEFFGGKDPAWMCGGAKDTPNTTATTPAASPSPSTDTK